ncbi:uncharacterized protein [Antedon mediterranea]|uniref:uncharacterized protein n=1 Tax=Antedon mediterranea TaxID=105859 RepID=UPI003AF4189A
MSRRYPVYYSDRARYRSPSRREKKLKEQYMAQYGNGNGHSYPPPSGDFVFSARFLGSKEMGAVEPAPETVGLVVRDMVEGYRYSQYKPRRYHIVIKSRKIVVEESGTDYSESIPIYAIQYCASDFNYPRAFTFVARARQGYLCHIFYTKGADVAEAITVSFARAFKRAYDDVEERRSVYQPRRHRDSSSDDDRFTRNRSRKSKKPREYHERYDYDTQAPQNVYSQREPRPMLNGGPPRSTRYFMYDDYPEDDRASTMDPIFSRRQGPTGERLQRYDFVEDEPMPRMMNGFSDDMGHPPRRSMRSSARRPNYPVDDMEMPPRRSMHGGRQSQRYSDPFREYSY